MSMKRVVLITVAAAFAAAAEDVWTLNRPYAWARDAGAASLVELPGGGFEARHTGARDWCVNISPPIAVRRGDVFEMSCEARELPGSPGPCAGSLSVILRGAKGKVFSWGYGAAPLETNGVTTTRFMVPRGVETIQPRVTGGGPAGMRVCAVRIMRTGNAIAEDAGDMSCEFGNGQIKCRVSGAGFEALDVRTGRIWAPPAGDLPVAEPVKCETLPGGAARISFIAPASFVRWSAEYRIEKDRPEVVVTIEGSGSMPGSISYPAPFATRRGDRLIVPMNEGIGYPADEEDSLPSRLIAYGGHGICMAFFGVQDDATGAGWMAILETPDDAALAARRDAETKLWTLGPEWYDQKKQFGYARRIRYIFLDKGGYVAMCKRYRAYAKEIGKFKTFAEKAKERPLVDRLLGAVNVWCWDKDKIAVVKELKAAGIDRFLWSGGGTEEQVKFMAGMPDVLVGRYDIYQDIYHPEQLKKLGWKRGSNTEAWPKDIVWNSADSNDWRHAWGVKAKDGTWTHCAMMCDSVAPAYERRNVAQELKTKPYNTRFVDTTVAAPWQTCWNPAHPMTRSDSRRWKMELLRILGDEFKLVVGSETGHDASVPFCDYFEGMLSLGPYRVPDSGRNIPQIWTNVPPRVAKYQVGEAYRLPLWELVYHECVCAHWYWGDYNNKLPSIWWKRDLFNMLYGTMGMFIFNGRQWAEDRGRFVESYRLTSPIARATGYSEMTGHRVLSPDRKVQESRFADGTVVTVNFGDSAFALPGGGEVPARGHVVRRD